MKELKLFLSALTRAMENKRGQFIPILQVIPTKFNAIKQHIIEVWLVDGDYKECISSVQSNINITIAEKEINKAIDSLVEDTIVNILNRYGIQ